MPRAIVLGSAALLLAALSSPAILHAQFLEPTKEELQMTADPKAPGATAVYLYYEDSTDELNRSRTFYERIKILTEKGKEMATVKMPYLVGQETLEVSARTIHADGKAIPMTEPGSDLTDLRGKGFEVKEKVFTLPGAEVGSILEYRLTVHYARFGNEPTWMIQQDEFVHKAHYFYKSLPLGALSYITRIGTDAKVVDDKKGGFTLDLTDVPPLPDEDWMPPLNTYKWRVYFFTTRYGTKEAFWDDAGKEWADFVRKFVNPTGTLKKAAAAMVAPGDTETVKAQKIYAAVMRLENTDFTREKTEVERKKEKIRNINNAQDVWRDQGGNGDEVALLYVALCRAAGLNVEPMKVVDRSQAQFDDSWLSARQLDDYIAVAQLDGKRLYLDPGQKMCPFGMLHWKHSLSKGFWLSDDKTVIISRTPSGSANASFMQRVADLTVDTTGMVKGSVRIGLGGQDALYWRQMALENDADEVKKRFNESVRGYLPEGLEVDFDHFLALDKYDTSLVAVLRISGALATSTGKRFFLPGLLFEVNSKHPFVAEEKRAIPVDVHYAMSEEDDVTFHLSAGFVMESGPQTDNVGWPDHAKFRITTTQDADSVNVNRSLIYNYTILDPKDYGALHDFYQKVAAADQQQLILTRGAKAAGN